MAGDEAVAVFDYGDEDSREAVPLDEFEGLLADWRARVIEAQAHETREVRETGRRNPWP